MNPPAQTGAPPKKKGNGVTTPSRRGGSGRVLTDVIVDLGFVEQGVVDEAVARAEDDGRAARAAAGQGRHDHRRPARARGRRALRARPRRPQRLPRRPRRRQARHARGGPALPGRAGLVRRRAHAAGRHVRPGQRARAGRHRRHDRLRGAPRGRLGGRHRPAARAPRGPGLRQRRLGPARGRRRDRRAAPAGTVRAGRADVRLQGAGPDQLRRLGRGLLGHPARAPGHQGGRRARLLRHPLRARRRGHARPLPDRRRAHRGGRHPRQRRARPSSRA